MTAVSSQPVRGSRFPILEKYDVLEELGHGGMATVYRALDLRLGREVAVKVIHPHLRDSAEAVRRFSIEARAVAKLRHPNIVEVYDVSSASEAEQYLVVELLRGVTLRRLLERHGALPAEVAASICVELLGAIAHAHDAGVIHRDVKPENVILEHRAVAAPPATGSDPAATSAASVPSGTFATPPASGTSGASEGERIAVKLTDFGIAKLLESDGMTSTGQVLGSPAHMAPEQIEGRDVDGRADVFALGVLFYECLVGHLPFHGTNPAQVLRRVLDGEYANAERERPTVGQAWSRIVDRALAPDLARRFATAVEMRSAIVSELDRLGVKSPRGEIQAWLDAPESFQESHASTMTACLCGLAKGALARRDVLSAAADYNRALAYAPTDTALLRLVSRMNRQHRRAATARRTLPFVLAAGALSLVAWGVRRQERSQAPVAGLPTEGRPSPSASVSTTVASAVVSAPPTASAVAELAPSARTVARPVVGARLPPPTRPTSRELRFSSVDPPQGVLVAVDGAPASPLEASRTLTFDERAHSLVFTCAHDLCEPMSRVVEPGERPAQLAVHMTIKASKLLIRGVDGRHYFLNDDPQHTLQVNEFPNVIPMTQSAVRVVKVTELETARSLSVELHAGQASKPVDFAATP